MDAAVPVQEPISVVVRHTEQISDAGPRAAGRAPVSGTWFAIAFAFTRAAGRTSFEDCEGYGTGDTKAAAQSVARQTAEKGLRRRLSARGVNLGKGT